MPKERIPREIIFKYMAPAQYKYMEDLIDREELEDSNEDFPSDDIIKKIKDIPKAVLTTAGILDIDSNYAPFEFWEAHTNFIISDLDRLAIKECIGVESLTILTPHRFKIAIAQYFVINNLRSKVLKGVAYKLKAKPSAGKSLNKKFQEEEANDEEV